jgi:hypothetical protein
LNIDVEGGPPKSSKSLEHETHGDDWVSPAIDARPRPKMWCKKAKILGFSETVYQWFPIGEKLVNPPLFWGIYWDVYNKQIVLLCFIPVYPSGS